MLLYISLYKILVVAPTYNIWCDWLSQVMSWMMYPIRFCGSWSMAILLTNLMNWESLIRTKRYFKTIFEKEQDIIEELSICQPVWQLCFISTNKWLCTKGQKYNRTQMSWPGRPDLDVWDGTSWPGRPGQDFASCLRRLGRPGQDVCVLLYFCPFVVM